MQRLVGLLVRHEGRKGLPRSEIASETAFRPFFVTVEIARQIAGHKRFRPLNALISAPAEAIGPAIHDGKEGEQHAEDLGLMDALRGGARAHLLYDLNCKKGRLLNDLNAKSGLDCVAERIYCKRQPAGSPHLANHDTDSCKGYSD